MVELLLQFHAEMECSATEMAEDQDVDEKSYNTFLNSRPQTMEVEAIKLIIKLCKQFK